MVSTIILHYLRAVDSMSDPVLHSPYTQELRAFKRPLDLRAVLDEQIPVWKRSAANIIWTCPPHTVLCCAFVARLQSGALPAQCSKEWRDIVVTPFAFAANQRQRILKINSGMRDDGANHASIK